MSTTNDSPFKDGMNGAGCKSLGIAATDRQEGGGHYKGFAIQPVEFLTKNDIPWCEANAIKYLCRHRMKNGKEDVLKARHYIDLLLELEYATQSE